jgi:hypothetical protein
MREMDRIIMAEDHTIIQEGLPAFLDSPGI